MKPGRALLGCMSSDTASLQWSSQRSAPKPKAPDISVELTSTGILDWNTYKFGRYYDANDLDWFVLTSTKFLVDDVCLWPGLCCY